MNLNIWEFVEMNAVYTESDCKQVSVCKQVCVCVWEVCMNVVESESRTRVF